MVLKTKLNQLTDQLQPIMILCVGCVYSLLIATNIRCHGSLAMFMAEETSPNLVPQSAVDWLGAAPGMVTYLFVPLFTGAVDHFKLSYRLCAMTASGAIAVGSFASIGFTDPGQLILTDTVLSGFGASLMLSTIILVIDDNFPATSSGLRILATTLVQGVAYATFFLVDAHSAMVNRSGWRAAFFVYGGAATGLGLLAAVLLDRRPRPLLLLAAVAPTTRTDGGDLRVGDDQKVAGGNCGGGTSVIDSILEGSEWRRRLLSLSQSQMDSSRTILLWMLERLLASCVSDGAFLYLLVRSGIARHPAVPGSTPSPRLPNILPAFAFSVGSTTSYLGGAVLGSLIPGRLLNVYMTSVLVNVCTLIGWSAVAGWRGGDGGYNADLAFAWACGVGVGGINTFAYAASEEATGIPARSIFPYTKLANGLSIAIVQVANGGLVGAEGKHDRLLVVLLLLSVAQFAALLAVKRLRGGGALQSCS